MPNGVPIGNDLTSAGLKWTRDEFEVRLELAPEKIERSGGIFVSDRQRLLVLAMLLETLGTESAVRLGSVDAWEQAVAAQRTAEQSDPVGR